METESKRTQQGKSTTAQNKKPGETRQNKKAGETRPNKKAGETRPNKKEGETRLKEKGKKVENKKGGETRPGLKQKETRPGLKQKKNRPGLKQKETRPGLKQKETRLNCIEYTFMGAFMGSILGLGSGLIKKNGFKALLGEAGSSAKTFAILFGVHQLVYDSVREVCRKDDAFTAGFAGCVTGLSLTGLGSPQALAQSCVAFGGFSVIFHELSKPKRAIAGPLSVSLKEAQNSLVQVPFPVLPPFTLPSLFKGISALYQSKPHP